MEVNQSNKLGTLITERLTIRPLVEEDIVQWSAFFENNPNLKYLGIPKEEYKKPTIELAETWVNRQLNRYNECQLGMLAILKDGQLIGNAGIIPREVDGDHYFEMAYSFIPKHWGNGYAPEACKAILNKARKLKISESFISIIHKENHNSIRVAEKNGMAIIKETTFLDIPVYVYQINFSSE